MDAYLATIPDARRAKFLAAELRRWEALYAQWEANPDLIPDADAYDFALTLAEIGRRL